MQIQRNPIRRLTALFLGSALVLGACTTAPSTDPPSPPPPGPSGPVPPAPVGTPLGSPITGVIGPGGGQLALPDGSVRISIPPGALSQEQTVGIQEMTNTATGQVGKAYRLTPEGLTFAQPVRLTFGYTEEEVVGTAPEVLSLGYQDEAGVWQMYREPQRDLAARTVSVETRHFSHWSKLAGYQIQPLQAEVGVGKSVVLKVVACTQETQDPSGITVPVPADAQYTCRKTPGSNAAQNWSVNGLPAGSSSVGTVAPLSSPGVAEYTAPAQVPSRNPVAVSVALARPRSGPVTLVANVKVTEPQAWQGYVFYTERGSQPWKMTDGFEGAGLQSAKQTHTFKVVGFREIDAFNTTLVLEQEASAEYLDQGHKEKKIYEICEAFGPTILRHHFIYDRNFVMRGSLKTTLEARLNIVNGHYSLAINPQDVQMTGQDTTTDLYQDGCAHTTNDRSNSKPVKYPASPELLKVEGLLDTAHPNTLSGRYENQGELFTQRTQYLVSWDLTRGE
ncbi:MAG: hypothetical protein JWQ08_1487 [Deinococcus sp.]|nr:hypothetical protein [Deinococcus sp.]